MSNIRLELDSAIQILEDPRTDRTNFTTTYPQPIDLKGFAYEVALTVVDTWFTSFNIIGKTLVWSSDNNVTLHTITIPNGNYPVEDVNSLLQMDQISKGVTGTDPFTDGTSYGVQIIPNYNTNRAMIVIDNSVGSGNQFTIDLTQANNLSDYLGFNPAVISVSTTGENLPDVNAGQDNWNIKCDLVRNSYSGGVAGQIIYKFVPGNVDVSEKIYIEPLHLTFLQVNKEIINEINIQLLDQDGNQVDLQGSDLAVTLLLRPIQK